MEPSRRSGAGRGSIACKLTRADEMAPFEAVRPMERDARKLAPYLPYQPLSVS